MASITATTTTTTGTTTTTTTTATSTISSAGDIKEHQEKEEKQAWSANNAFNHFLWPFVSRYSSHMNECNDYATPYDTDFTFCSNTNDSHQSECCHNGAKMAASAKECFFRWLSGGREPTRGEKSVLYSFEQYLSPQLFGSLVDYSKVSNFSFNCGAILKKSLSDNDLFNNSDISKIRLPDFIYEGGLVEVQDGNTYAWSCKTEITKLSERSAEYNHLGSSSNMTSPENKAWAIGSMQWVLVSGPDNLSDKFGEAAGVELLVGFVSHFNKNGKLLQIDDGGNIVKGKDGVEEGKEKEEKNEERESIHLSTFEMLGYATLSERGGIGIGGEIGCGFYKFSIDSKGVVSGVEAGQHGEDLWSVPVNGHCTCMPFYCKKKLLVPSKELSQLDKSKTINELKMSFENLRNMIDDGRLPNICISDVISKARNIRNGPLGQDWNKEIAKEFGLLLKSIKNK
jgi:hypothetical protein